MIRISDAIASLRPGADWAIQDDTYAGLIWHSTSIPKPTEVEVTAEFQRLQTEYITKNYARKRAAEYPPIGDQLDALWKGGDAATEMLAKVQAVKAKYPKPE
jgi:hypothetical protein